jgi:hypothetical protein
MMDLKRIEDRMTVHVMNVALAAIGKQEGDLRAAKEELVREVARIARDAYDSRREECQC